MPEKIRTYSHSSLFGSGDIPPIHQRGFLPRPERTPRHLAVTGESAQVHRSAGGNSRNQLELVPNRPQDLDIQIVSHVSKEIRESVPGISSVDVQ
jgi:hypothetical protein